MRVQQHGTDSIGAAYAGASAGGLPADLANELDTVRFATILFADIIGSTQLIAALNPEDARDLLDKAIAIIRQAIHDFGGRVVRVQGDGVMAVFGISPAIEDHPLRAALAGRAIVDRMKERPALLRPAPQVRVGLHSGPVLLRRQDNDFGSILDVVGHATHVAGQIEKLAPPASVAISATAVSLIAEACELVPAGAVASGTDEPGEAVFELLSVDFTGGGAIPIKGSANGPLIGRETELEAVRTAIGGLASGAKGTAMALGFAGEAGTGKSRILLEAARLSAGMGVTALIVRGNALLAAVPFAGLAGPVRCLIDLLRPLEPDSAIAAVLTGEQMACLHGLSANDPDWLSLLVPSDRSHITTQTIVRLGRLASQRMPLLLLVDDAQYLDAESLGVLEQIRASSAMPMMIGVRTEAVGCIEPFCDKVLALAPLAPADARTLLERLSPETPLEDGVIGHIVERAQGLPLALHEFALSAHDRRGREDPTEGVCALPARLDALLGARLAVLDGEAMRLCEFCATLGVNFPVSRLQQGAAMLCRDPQAAISRLAQSGIVEFVEAGRARFAHQLMQEAAYRTMARHRRMAMHVLALDLLSTPGPGGAESETASHAELATHAEKAGLPTRALGHLWDACQQALSLAAIDSVRQLYDRAREVAGRLEPAAAAFERARFSLLAYDTLQQLSREQVTREDMLALATGRIDMGPGVRTVARINMALLDWINGAPEQGSVWLAQAEVDLDAHDSLPRRNYADMVGGYLTYAQSLPGEAIARIERLGNRMGRDAHGSTFGAVVVIPHVLARAFGAWYLTDLGDRAKARSWAAEALRLSRRHRHDYSRLLADLARGYMNYREGRFERAVAILRAAHAHCLRHTFYGFEPVSAAWLALPLIELGALDEAGAVLAESMERGHFRKLKTSATYYLHEARTRLALARGDGARAVLLATEALGHCHACGDTMHALHAHVLSREVEAATGHTVQATHDVTAEWLEQRVAKLGIVPLAQKLAALKSARPGKPDS